MVVCRHTSIIPGSRSVYLKLDLRVYAQQHMRALCLPGLRMCQTKMLIARARCLEVGRIWSQARSHAVLPWSRDPLSHFQDVYAYIACAYFLDPRLI